VDAAIQRAVNWLDQWIPFLAGRSGGRSALESAICCGKTQRSLSGKLFALETVFGALAVRRKSWGGGRGDWPAERLRISPNRRSKVAIRVSKKTGRKLVRYRLASCASHSLVFALRYKDTCTRGHRPSRSRIDHQHARAIAVVLLFSVEYPRDDSTGCGQNDHCRNGGFQGNGGATTLDELRVH